MANGMMYGNVSILSLAFEDAPHRITSEEIEDQLDPLFKMFGVERGLLEKLTGIVARRFWDEGVQPSQVATIAAEKAIAAAGIEKEKLGVLVSTSVCKDFIEPSIASMVHGCLGLAPNCMSFDIGNACLAFLNGMQVVGNMIERGQIDYGIIVDGEGSRFAVESTIKRLLQPNANPMEFRSNFATLTLGSGAVSAVLCRSDLAPDKPQFKGGVTVAATEHRNLCIGQPDEMVTDAKALLVAGIDLAEKTLERANEVIGWDFPTMDHYIMHQVSKANTEKLCDRLSIDREKVFTTYEEFGNTGPAALPLTLAKAVEAGRIKKGDRIAMMGIGSGINCSMMEAIW